MSATSVGYLSQQQQNANQFVKFSHMTCNAAKGGMMHKDLEHCVLQGGMYYGFSTWTLQ